MGYYRLGAGAVNRIDMEMKVDTLSERESISSDYAFHNLGGINRAVRVFALPATHIAQLHLDAGLDKEYRDGELRLSAVVEGGTARRRTWNCPLNCGTREASWSNPRFPGWRSKRSRGARRLRSKHKWRPRCSGARRNRIFTNWPLNCAGTTGRWSGSNETSVSAHSKFAAGNSISTAASSNWGIANHEIDPLTGRANTAVHSEEDVRLLKEANLNHIRTIHYPPNAELLDAADRLGMYVEVEAPVCWNGAATDDAAHKEAVLRPVRHD